MLYKILELHTQIGLSLIGSWSQLIRWGEDSDEY